MSNPCDTCTRSDECAGDYKQREYCYIRDYELYEEAEGDE